MLHSFLRSRGLDLEESISWFFAEYLPAEFNVSGFSFARSATDSSFLERTRHLLVEMESIAHQFALYVAEGEIDRGLLAVMSDAVSYKQLPSLHADKYVYVVPGTEIVGVVNALFSDQSPIRYVNENLEADSAAELLVHQRVAYDNFEVYQRPLVDRLIALGVLHIVDGCVRISSLAHFRTLHSLYAYEALSYYHLSDSERALTDSFVEQGWLRRASSLLTTAEASYFNYQLNNAEFHNGPRLRNRYLHGSQAQADEDDAHFSAYLTTLKLTVALVVKLNDEFCLRDGRAPG